MGKRPAAVTWLALAVFLLAGANAIRTGVTVLRWPVYSSLQLEIPIWLPAAAAAVWSIAWLVVGIGLWRLKGWARLAAMVLFPLYELSIFAQELLFTQGVYARGRLPLAILVGLALSGIVVWILTRPYVRQAFED